MTVNDERVVSGLFPKRVAPFLFVILAIAFVIVVRLRLLDVPLERDEGEYAYMGQLILDGIPPYSQAYNMKLPGIYFLYALVILVFGQTGAGIHLGLLLFNVASIVLMYFIGKSLVNEWVGASASAAFAMLSLSNRVQSLWANAEHFVLPFALAGFLALLYYKRNERLSLLVLSGALFGIGTLVKQHGFFLGISGFVFLIAIIFKRSELHARSAARDLLWFVAAGAMPLVLSLIYVYWSGVFDRFWFWAFTYARAYLTQIQPAGATFSFLSNFFPLFKATSPIWILAALGCAAVLVSGPLKPYRWFCLSFLVGGFAAISPGYFFRPHYFVLILPSVALLFGLGVEFLTQLFKPIEGKILRLAIPAATAVIALLSPIASHADIFFQSSNFFVARATYGGHPLSEAKTISRFLEAWSAPEDRIGIIGSEPEMFFYTKRRSATGYLYHYSVIERQPYAQQMMREMTAEIESASPRFLLYVQVEPIWYKVPESVSELLRWYRRYSDSCYTVKARYEWTPGLSTAIMVMDEEILRKPPQQDYYVIIHERKRATNR